MRLAQLRVNCSQPGTSLACNKPQPALSPFNHDHSLGSTHTPQSRQAADKALRQTCALLGLVGVSTHSFRRTLATDAVRRGVALNVVQQITGQKSLGSLGHYLEADETEVLAAIIGV
ncbi:MAG: phage integrase family protein [Cyanobacteria bacterium K_Offshore_0m_m2_072]|nr:phage integrase family protein [Cyanobacteria bacterium K_Offshore_0m_m2_072]